MELSKIAERKVEPEWLDRLPADDPRAIRSRRELRWINALMRNESWILQKIQQHSKQIKGPVTEWGAGEGELCRKIKQALPNSEVSAIDLVAAPPQWPSEIAWHMGDLTEMKPIGTDLTIVANLFLHHLTNDQLRQLQPWWENASLIIINEPLRKHSSHFWGRCLWPILHDVTRHDMHISIDAGFVRGELKAIMLEQSQQWQIDEWEQWPGAYRSVWRRK